MIMIEAETDNNKNDIISKIESKISELDKDIERAKLNEDKQQTNKLETKKDQILTTKILLEKTYVDIASLKSKIETATINDDGHTFEILSEKLNKSENRASKLNDRSDKQFTREDLVKGYDIEDISHAFTVVDPYVMISKGYISIDYKRISTDENVSIIDIQIMKDFAKVNNMMMSQAYVGQTNQELVDEVMENLESGKFHKMFDPIVEQSEPHQISYGVGESQITYVLLQYIPTTIKSVFGVSEEPPIQEIRHGTTPTWWTFTACGGGYNNPHTNYVGNLSDTYSSASAAKSHVISSGYHQILPLFSGHYPNDYGRTDTTAPGTGLCDTGAFREQALIYSKSTGTKINYEHDEPNPELTRYVWPATWWGNYANWWHNVYA